MPVDIPLRLIDIKNHLGQGSQPEWADEIDDVDLESILAVVLSDISDIIHISIIDYHNDKFVRFDTTSCDDDILTYNILKLATNIDTSNLIVLSVDEDGFSNPTTELLDVRRDLEAFGVDPENWRIFTAFDMWFVQVTDHKYWIARKLACEPGMEHVGWITVTHGVNHENSV